MSARALLFSREKNVPAPGTTMLWRVKIAMLVLHAIVGIAQLIITLATDTFTFNGTVVDTLRAGPADASQTPSVSVTGVDVINATFVFATTNLFAALAYIIVMFFNSDELERFELGLIRFVWIVALFGGVPIWLAVELAAGMAAWTEFVLAGVLFAASIGVYWLATDTLTVFGDDDDSLRKWMSFLTIGTLQTALNFVVLVSASVKTINGGPGIHLLPVISAVAFSYAPLWVLVVGTFQWISQRTALTALYVVLSLTIIVVSWLGLVAFATDGLTFP